MMRDPRKRKYRLPAGNWPPYVRACLRRGLRFRALALAVSLLATGFFATALWLALAGEEVLGMGTFQAGLGCISQLVASVFLALDLLAASNESRAGVR
jgi:hypothetical protein